jgi:hypothetical protein
MVAVAGTFKDTLILLVWRYSLKGDPMRFFHATTTTMPRLYIRQ